MIPAQSQALILKEKSGELTTLPDNDQWKNRFEIKSSSSNRLYIVAQNKKIGTWGCSCMGWIRYKHCRHLKELQPLLEEINKEELKFLKEK